jgi:predicted GNAT family acetyltransferase
MVAWSSAHLSPVPLQRWHVTTLSPFLSRPLPSQFLHFCFFLVFGPFSFGIVVSLFVIRKASAGILARRRQRLENAVRFRNLGCDTVLPTRTTIVTTTLPTSAAVRDNSAENRFELFVEGAMAFADYRRLPGRVVITHTETPRALRGRGIASQLVAGALDLIRADGDKVVAGCGFVADYLDQHPEYSDLVG